MCSCFDSHTSSQKTFESVGSSEEDTSMQSTVDLEKQPSFNHVVTHTIEPMDNDTDYVNESEIDDDEGDSGWKTASDDAASDDEFAIDDDWQQDPRRCTFERTDQTNLNDHISLLTLALGKRDNHAPQSPPAINSSRTSHPPLLGVSPSCDDGPLMMKDMRQSTPKSTIEAPRSSAQPIAAPTAPIPIPAALSPYTTRQNMLETELTESLRRQLHWERQQKSLTANAVRKRRRYGPSLKRNDDANAPSRFVYLGGYHSRGW
jgi:hypothetical protein